MYNFAQLLYMVILILLNIINVMFIYALCSFKSCMKPFWYLLKCYEKLLTMFTWSSSANQSYQPEGAG